MKEKNPKTKKDIEIVAPEEVKKDLSKPVTFRADSETYSKIITLEKSREESKAEVIKSAINKSFEMLLFQQVNFKFYEYMINIFGKSAALSAFIKSGGRNAVIEELDNKNPFEEKVQKENTSQVTYITKTPEYETKNKNMRFCLNIFVFEMTYKVNNNIKIKFSMNDVITGEINKLQPDLYLKVLEIASKNSFKTETKGETKKSSLTIFFEREAPIIAFKDWIDQFKKDLKDFKKMTDQIESFVKSDKNIEKKETSEQLPK